MLHGRLNLQNAGIEESRIGKAPQSGVFRVGGHEHAFGQLLCIGASKVELCLLQLRTGIVDLRPCFRVGEGELIWSDADGRTILGVNGIDALVEVATRLVPRSGKAGGSPEKRTGIFRQWMERRDIVDEPQNGIGDDLLLSAYFQSPATADTYRKNGIQPVPTDK